MTAITGAVYALCTASAWLAIAAVQAVCGWLSVRWCTRLLAACAVHCLPCSRRRGRRAGLALSLCVRVCLSASLSLSLCLCLSVTWLAAGVHSSAAQYTARTRLHCWQQRCQYYGHSRHSAHSTIPTMSMSSTLFYYIRASSRLWIANILVCTGGVG